MYSCELYLQSATSLNHKFGVESFYNYISKQLKEHNGCGSINCYSNPLQITLCIYFMLLTNHRFYKGCNRKKSNFVKNASANNNNNESSIFMSDGSDITNNEVLPATNSFYKASNFNKVTPSISNNVVITIQNPPFPISMLYALPVTGCVEYLRLKIDENDKIGKEMIEKSI